MNDTVRNGRLTEYIKEQVSEFIARESNHSSLVTVTRVRLANSLKKAEVLITVYPEEKEQEVLNFGKAEPGISIFRAPSTHLSPTKTR